MRPRLRFAVVIACTFVSAGAGCKPHGDEETGDVSGSSSMGTGDGSSSAGTQDRCGDGVVVAPEACDDGNQLDGDGCNSDCQISGSQAWCKAEIGDDGGTTIGNSVAVDSEGNVIVVGYAFSAEAQARQALVAKYTHAGELAWTRRLPSAADGNGVLVRADDSIVASTIEPHLFHLTSSGELAQTLPLPDTFALADNSLTQSPTGMIAFAANTLGGERRAVIGALNDDLSLAWTQVIDDLGDKIDAYAIAPDLEGNWLLGGAVVLETFVTGEALIEVTGGFVRKYDRQGGLVWTQPLLSPHDKVGLIITAIRPGAANEAVVLGVYANQGELGADPMLATISSEGQLLEQVAVPHAESALVVRDLVLTPNGDRILAGTIWPADPMSHLQAFTARYSPDGSLQWLFHNTLVPDNASGFDALREDAAGDLFATGVQRVGPGSEDRILICKIRR